MSKRRNVVTWTLSCLFVMAGQGRADLVCPDSSYCQVTFNRTYPSGSQFRGQPYDYVSIAPDWSESFFNLNGVSEADGLPDVDIRVYLRDCSGAPLVGVPAEEILIQSSNLCICPGGNQADAATDAEGCARFTGQLNAGGCSPSLEVWVGGVFVCELRDATGRTVKVNSPDYGHVGTSPCFVDASDLALLALQLGRPAAGRICFDLQESGGNIDASDLSWWASSLGAACTW